MTPRPIGTPVLFNRLRVYELVVTLFDVDIDRHAYELVGYWHPFVVSQLTSEPVICAMRVLCTVRTGDNSAQASRRASVRWLPRVWRTQRSYKC